MLPKSKMPKRAREQLALWPCIANKSAKLRKDPDYGANDSTYSCCSTTVMSAQPVVLLLAVVYSSVINTGEMCMSGNETTLTAQKCQKWLATTTPPKHIFAPAVSR